MTSLLSTDPLLSAVAAFPRPLLLTEKDVAALLRCSTRLLQQWRADGVSPPAWMALGPKLVRYPAAALIAWIDGGAGTSKAPRSIAATTVAPVTDGLFAPDWAGAGFDEPPFRGGRRPKVRRTSFMGLLSTGLPDEEWLFVVRSASGRPIEFVESLQHDRSDDDEVVWLRLDEYLEASARAAAHAAASSFQTVLEESMPDAEPNRYRREPL
ncbi:hypothetical protein DFR29_113170 [Tahibacter aquaticus]|uniref:Helix-turn-helix protein n=1 Tax=Tahibacter aquaticus TaxID=520092 RepID=A0A4R6YR87_9GAMM|nr:helix-turn-helix domain-containing protein [Tahibacter aquaticus]TDR40468.1 hypothetical protein DFR29_113170 [Tahibacter aquaticus]